MSFTCTLIIDNLIPGKLILSLFEVSVSSNHMVFFKGIKIYNVSSAVEISSLYISLGRLSLSSKVVVVELLSHTDIVLIFKGIFLIQEKFLCFSIITGFLRHNLSLWRSIDYISVYSYSQQFIALSVIGSLICHYPLAVCTCYYNIPLKFSHFGKGIVISVVSFYLVGFVSSVDLSLEGNKVLCFHIVDLIHVEYKSVLLRSYILPYSEVSCIFIIPEPFSVEVYAVIVHHKGFPGFQYTCFRVVLGFLKLSCNITLGILTHVFCIYFYIFLYIHYLGSVVIVGLIRFQSKLFTLYLYIRYQLYITHLIICFKVQTVDFEVLLFIVGRYPFAGVDLLILIGVPCFFSIKLPTIGTYSHYIVFKDQVFHTIYKNIVSAQVHLLKESSGFSKLCLILIQVIYLFFRLYLILSRFIGNI